MTTATTQQANPLRTARVAAGIGTAYELAGLSGVSAQSVYDIENGARPRFSDATIIRLAPHVGREAGELIDELRAWYAALEESTGSKA